MGGGVAVFPWSSWQPRGVVLHLLGNPAGLLVLSGVGGLGGGSVSLVLRGNPVGLPMAAWVSGLEEQLDDVWLGRARPLVGLAGPDFPQSL